MCALLPRLQLRGTEAGQQPEGGRVQETVAVRRVSVLMLVLTAGTRVPTALRRRWPLARRRRQRWLLMLLGALCARPVVQQGKEPVERG